ncbi:MAG TPA: 3-oxoacyl-ACP reductase [Rhodospirillaceae bacterium]|nr:3-oxoacyl-ACP reductase [Alphaproteobacteria bacterium]MAS49158.1 3-oxoacyl-ACP reductase [Alphaproteobacteria bacterium]MAX97240.1 3-oxoacyl-ACP reductase [Alphaproteobacteria bacterium]OUT39754.1 MAG: 3-oxoacyl-ACP reductase [Micavibrio sp. TMED2]HCI47834.1 3-oxoacyl-ACP reductase [Rhodospirillaceae bacterium]|tara:strand:+ start:66465 stop:67244 length:780 start_codon:yes stop_codon:yes gene_type:complete
MDLGLTGKTALVCAASKGLGRACAEALAAEGCAVTITARDEAQLIATAREIEAKTGQKVGYVAGDITTEEGQAAALLACPTPDIMVNNAGGPPPGDFRDWSRDDWIKALDANMLTAIMLSKAVVDGMAARKFGRIINITSAAVKAPIELLGLSNGSRAGLTGFMAGLARQLAGDGITINNLLPGPFETDRLKSTLGAVADKTGRPIADVRAERMAQNPAGRFGDPVEFGAACAFLASDKAGFINGQNLVLDGGAFRGTL